ncbi:chitinase-like protein Idgf4 [Uranotaenia lowii]|uniref:chitinase-like protein Idgf4 n=1 Tax=Uranotaenia lowii TaxID=190385 RepID=UPI0024793D6D|nr:chitinase-like protein Idgf4 [Uranotaenia lowii]
MWCKAFAVLLLLVALVRCQRNFTTTGPKVLCYYDGSHALKDGPGQVTVPDIELALPYCTHLMYGFASIDVRTNRIRPVDASLDLDSGKGQYRVVTALKKRFPNLKIFLSIGFYKDLKEEKPFEKYLTLLESAGERRWFVDSVYSLLKTYEFNGLDLAWQFPQTKPKRIRDWKGKLWHGFKKVFTGDSILDPKADEHREEFTALVRELKEALRADNYELGLTVLPHVNETMFMDVPLLKDYVDYINLAAFDQQTPERNPKEGDYTGPIYEPEGRVEGNNIDAKVNHWLSHNTPINKIIIGIPTYGRGWKLIGESGVTGVPPILATGPAASDSGSSGTDGFFSWPEICSMLPNPGNAHLKGWHRMIRVGDPTKRYGVYAYRIADEHDENGIWLSYEDPDSAGNKAAYAKAKGLGGVSIFDLGNDDVRGICAGDKFPILRAAKYRL